MCFLGFFLLLRTSASIQYHSRFGTRSSGIESVLVQDLISTSTRNIQIYYLRGNSIYSKLSFNYISMTRLCIIKMELSTIIDLHQK